MKKGVILGLRNGRFRLSGASGTLETLEIWGPRGLRTLDLATFGPFWGPFGRVLFEACSVLTTFR